MLVDKSGKITAVILSVGGFLGMDTKDVAAPFQAIHTTMKDNKWWLTMNTSKESLKSAPGYRYDKNTATWVADQVLRPAAVLTVFHSVTHLGGGVLIADAPNRRFRCLKRKSCLIIFFTTHSKISTLPKRKF